MSQYATNDDPGVGPPRLIQQSVSTQAKLLAGDSCSSSSYRTAALR